MSDIKLTQQIKRHEVIVAAKAHHSNTDFPDHKAISTPNFVWKEHKIIVKSRGNSIRAIVKDIKLSECTIRKVVNEDVRYKTYATQRGRFMSVETKWPVRNTYWASQNTNSVEWFDFSLMGRNDRWLCRDTTEIWRVIHSKLPSTAMVVLFCFTASMDYLMPTNCYC